MVRASGLRRLSGCILERADRTGRRLLVERIVVEGVAGGPGRRGQGISAATAYKGLRRWRSEGEAGLADRSCRPHTSPRRLPVAREQAILAWRHAHRVGPNRIGWALGGGHRLLGRGQGGANHDRRHGLGYDYLHVAVDDRSRLAHVEAHDRQDGLAAAGFTARALAWFAQLGVPVERVLTDNGWCYRSQAFQQVRRQAGTPHRRTRPYRPQTNGKAERFNLTLAVEWSYAQLYASNQGRLDALPGWLHHYNHHRPHAALDGRSPMQLLNNLPGNHT